MSIEFLQFFLQLLIAGLVLGAVYISIALGLTLVYGILKILHIAHAGVYVIGAYLGLITYSVSNNLLLAFLVAATGSAIIGLAIERLLYLPLLNKPRYVPLMISIALFILIEEGVANLAGHEPKSFSVDIPNYSFTLGPILITQYQILFMGIIYSLTLAIWLLLNKTLIGLASRALIQDIESAEANGINKNRIIDFNFIIGSALAGLVGMLVGIYYYNVKPYMGEIVAYKSLVVILLGGFGSVPGTILGGIILGISEAFLSAFFNQVLPTEAFAFIIMILLLIFRPQGLLGKME